MGSGASAEALKEKEQELETLKDELKKNKEIIAQILENKKNEDERKRKEEDIKKVFKAVFSN